MLLSECRGRVLPNILDYEVEVEVLAYSLVQERGRDAKRGRRYARWKIGYFFCVESTTRERERERERELSGWKVSINSGQLSMLKS